MNEFVKYLNGLHNYNAQNQNAYGERNVESAYYSKTMVKINVCEHIVDLINNHYPHIIILTGHAGDGKTSIMFQVLEILGKNPRFSDPVYEIDLNEGKKCYCIKDFSELSDQSKKDTLSTIIDYPEQGKYVFMVANTGPLINTFGELFESNCRDDAKMQLIEAMDSNDGRVREIAGYKMAVINMASIENTGFATQFLERITHEDLWKTCEACSKKDYCHILRNRNLIQEYKGGVYDFIQNYYIWQLEYGTRLTIRSITEHLSYMITGGFECESVNPDEAHKLLFSNLFFGYEGMVSNIFADNVLAVGIAKKSGIYNKRMRVDEKLLIQRDYESLFGCSIRNIIDSADEVLKQLKAWDDELKRIYLFMNIVDDKQHETDIEDIFSKEFLPYIRIRDDGNKPPKNMKDLVVDALHMMYLGTVLGNKNMIQITMNAESGVTQSVQLIVGQIYAAQINLVRKKDSDLNNGKYNLILQVNGEDIFKLKLPMLDYFDDLKSGVISTNMDPQLSHGIENLKAALLSKATIDEDSIEIVAMNNRGDIKPIAMDIEDGEITPR